MMKLDKFIEGENLDLCIPTEKFASQSDWYSWFNDKKIVKYSEYGLYPNTREEQKKFLNKSENRLILMISIKNKFDYIGTISLSKINYKKKNCHIALVLNTNKEYNPFIPLESIALMTEHAFEKLSMNLISAGQHVNLHKWQNMMELVGYKLEGLHKNTFIKGFEISDSFWVSCQLDDYILLKKNRGRLWDGTNKIKNRLMKKRKIRSYSNFLKGIYKNERKKYYQKVFNL